MGSQRVLEKAGFEREGYLRSRLPGPDGTRIDDVIRSCSPEDLLTERGPRGCDGSTQRRRWTIRPGGSQAEDAVVVAAAPVDDARPAGLLVVEQVEVVADEFHLEQGVVDGHRLGGVFLLPDDAPGLVVVVLAQGVLDGGRRRPSLGGGEADVGQSRSGQTGGGGGHGDRRVPPAVDAAAVGRAAQPGVRAC